MELREGGLEHPQVLELLAMHLAGARAYTPACYAHALDTGALAHPDVTFVTAWNGEALTGMAALRRLEPGHGEVKSMRTHPDFLRRGVARLLMIHLLELARARNWQRISLETGTAPSFAPANRLYETFGFVDGPVFGGYPPSPHNRFMTLTL